jgi:hypothetical protein
MSKWRLFAGPASQPVFGEMALTIIALELFLRNTPQDGLCYHVTEKDNRDRIQSEGIRIGAHCGHEPRDQMFPDSIYYIHASDTPRHAVDWCGRLGKSKDFVMFPIRLRDTGYKWFADPFGGETAFIINADHIAPEFLDLPISILP